VTHKVLASCGSAPREKDGKAAAPVASSAGTGADEVPPVRCQNFHWRDPPNVRGDPMVAAKVSGPNALALPLV
jgi:hypothetical protein